MAEETRLDEARAVGPEVITRGARKNTSRWCRGKVGRSHTLVIQIPPNAFWKNCGWHELRWRDERPSEWYYVCRHAELCTTCGKVLRRYLHWFRTKSSISGLQLEDCPEYQPRPGDLERDPGDRT